MLIVNEAILFFSCFSYIFLFEIGSKVLKLRSYKLLLNVYATKSKISSSMLKVHPLGSVKTRIINILVQGMLSSHMRWCPIIWQVKWSSTWSAMSLHLSTSLYPIHNSIRLFSLHDIYIYHAYCLPAFTKYSLKFTSYTWTCLPAFTKYNLRFTSYPWTKCVLFLPFFQLWYIHLKHNFNFVHSCKTLIVL